MKWYKHDTDATSDAKIRKLLIRHGAVGYAVYFHALELIASEVDESKLTFELEHDSEIIADNLKVRGTSEKSGIEIVEEVMRYIVSLGLFENSEGKITCLKMLHRLDQSMTSNPKMRQRIAAAKKNHDPVMIESCYSHERLEETRLDKNRKEQKRKADAHIEGFPINQTTHDKLVDEYGISTILHYYTTISDYVASKGKKDYADYSATARQWIKRDIEQGKGPKKKTKPKPMDEIELAIYNRQMEESER